MTYSEEEIWKLIDEKKTAPPLLPIPNLTCRNGHKTKDIPVIGAQGSEFSIKIRQSIENPLDFSVILAYHDSKTSSTFRLRRYNGSNHVHTNKLEREKILCKCHIHRATERYQKLGGKEDGFAESTDGYFDVESAMKCLIKDCNIQNQDDHGQMEIWDALPK